MIYSQGIAKASIRTTEDTEVKVRIITATGTATLSYVGSWAEIQETSQAFIDYTSDSVEVQIRLASTGVVAYESDLTSGKEVNVTPALDAATEYEVRARHLTDEPMEQYTRWSAWQAFTTIAE